MSLVHIIVDELCLCLLLDSIKIVAFPLYFHTLMFLQEMRNLVLGILAFIFCVFYPILLFSALFSYCNSAIVICSSLKATQNENGRKLEKGEEEVDGLSLSLTTTEKL